MIDSEKPVFWRDNRMPYVELRKVHDGRKVCYAPHSHTQWSLGAITRGQSTFLYRDDRYRVSEGDLVIVNPEWVHACNPIDGQPWGYLMLYVDTDWLARLRHEAGLLERPVWEDIPTATLTSRQAYDGYCTMAQCLLDPDRVLLEKQTAVVEYLTGFMQSLAGHAAAPQPRVPDNLQAVADYLKAHAASADVSLDSLCECTGYSAGYLIRSFKRHFGLTPHAYLINCRIQYAQQALKTGAPIAEAALEAGFADQPHFQRTFKRLLAATPQQYRRGSVDHQIDAAGRK